jgi:hypothetical protein
MPLDFRDLLSAGAYATALRLAMRGWSPDRAVERLSTLYPDGVPGDLATIYELAQLAYAAAQKFADLAPGEELDSNLIPPSPDVPAGMVEIQCVVTKSSAGTPVRQMYTLQIPGGIGYQEIAAWLASKPAWAWGADGPPLTWRS